MPLESQNKFWSSSPDSCTIFKYLTLKNDKWVLRDVHSFYFCSFFRLILFSSVSLLCSLRYFFCIFRCFCLLNMEFQICTLDKWKRFTRLLLMLLLILDFSVARLNFPHFRINKKINSLPSGKQKKKVLSILSERERGGGGR